MKKIKFFLAALLLITAALPAFSQKYKKPSDTLRLNKELLEVSNDIASLTSKLAIAQHNLPGYQNKASDAASDAQNTARESSAQASKATNGEVGDAKKAKRKAKKAFNDARDSQSADNNVKSQDKKIVSLGEQLQKKQEKFKELEDMRTAIRNMPN